MKQIILYSLTTLVLSTNLVQSQMIDILSEDDTLNVTSNNMDINENKDESLNIEENIGETSADNAENKNTDSEGIFSFITKPLSILFSANDTVVSAEGKKETFLERSIRQANEGKLEDQMNLGYMYLYGTNGVEQDFAKSLKYYQMAAEQNDSVAINNLGSLYFNGVGTKANPEIAIKLFQRSADLGNDNAATNLAFIYLTGGAKDEARNKKAVELFIQAQEAGNSIAKFMVGYAYYRGFVVEQDYAQAFKLIKETTSEKVNLDEAQIVLGDMYVNGLGTVQNYSKGINAYRIAANQGNLDSYMILGKIFAEGKIYPLNPVLAHAYYNIAASEEIEGAAEKRDSIGNKLKLEQLLQAQSEAQKFQTSPSELTSYIRKTFGNNIRSYIDNNITEVK